MILISGRCLAHGVALAVLLLVPVSTSASARMGDAADTSSLDTPVHTEDIRLPVVEGKDIRFTRTSGADLPKIMADRVQLQQVFLNLMLNGIEAMKDSGES